MQRKIAVIGKINDVKSFMRTYKPELRLENAEVNDSYYKMTFFNIGVVFYPGKEFTYEHLSLNNLATFNKRINDKIDAAIMINPTEDELRIVDGVKIYRAENGKERITFLPVNHTVGSAAQLDVKKQVADVLLRLTHGSLYEGEVPSGKLVQPITFGEGQHDVEPVNHEKEEGVPMLELSHKR